MEFMVLIGLSKGAGKGQKRSSMVDPPLPHDWKRPDRGLEVHFEASEK
jgi:hypothetical protein